MKECIDELLDYYGIERTDRDGIWVKTDKGAIVPFTFDTKKEKRMRDIKIINIVDDFSFEEIVNPIRVEKGSNEIIYSQENYDRNVIILDNPKYKVTMNDGEVVLLDGTNKMSAVDIINLIYTVLLEFKLGRYNGGNTPQNKNLLIVIDEPNASVDISIREWL